MINLPPPQPQTTTTTLPLPILSTTLEHLTSLLQLTEATLTALPLIALAAQPCPAALPCPNDPSHLIPPSSLLSHYLNCTSTVEIPQITHRTTFFYRNCPSAVTLPPHRPSPHAPTLHLPPTLLNACDVSNQQNSWTNRNASSCAEFFLPSEIWLLRRELESWGFGGRAPLSCSHTVLRAIMRRRHRGLPFLREWIVGRSLKYGVVIDFALADHIIVLVGLCLKATSMSNAEAKVQLNPSFECPVLGEVLTWLGLQLTVLYGEVNGMSFAIDMVRECVLESASRGCLFPLDGKFEDSTGILEVVSGVNEHLNSVILIDERGKEKEAEEIGNGEMIEENRISIAQVDEAISKLHERAVMEEHIKELRGSQLHTIYQRYKAHEHMSKIAEEERKRRPDYKTIIEHDGLLWQRLNVNGMDNGKTMTREDLLAEERDYKRRRMSYRAKRLKRNPLEVTRDIIEEYMAAIKEAGGISDIHTNEEKTEALTPENSQIQTVASTKRSESESRRESHHPRKGSFSHHDSVEHCDKQRSRNERSEHVHEYSNRNVSERISDRDMLHAMSFVGVVSKRARESPKKNHRKRYKDGDECRHQSNDRKRYSDGEDSTHRKRERYIDDRDYGRDRKSKN